MSLVTGTGGSIVAAQDSVFLDVSGWGTAAVQIAGTFTGTISFEVSVDGYTFVACSVTPPGSTTSVTSATAAGVWAGSVAGMRVFRARASAWTNGAATVTVQAAPTGGGGSGAGGGGGGGAVTIADGADVTEGAIADAKVTGDNAGTISAKLRGLDYLWALVVDTVNSWVKVSVQNFSTINPSLSIAVVQATASGDTTLLSSGTRKLRRLEASNSSSSVAVTAGLKVPSLNGGATFGKKYLPAAGGLAVWVFPQGYLQVTAETVSVNLSAGSAQVEFTAYYE